MKDRNYTNKIVVIKYGGNAMINETLKISVMKDLVELTLKGIKVVLVHGGGPEISSMLEIMGKETRFINGLRYTDAETAEIAAMVLAGKVNKSLVSLIQFYHGKAVGICGLDGGMLQVEKLQREVDLGFVGDIKTVDTAVITMAVNNGFIPVIATIGADKEGQIYNINADTAAGFIAAALKADRMIAMTDVRGLLMEKDNDDTLIKEIGVSKVPGLIEKGIISGGMIPKIQSCAEVVKSGVREVSIIDGRIEHSILIALLSDEAIGTSIYQDQEE